MEVAKVVVANPCWMNPIIDFLAEDKVPDDEDEAKKIRRVAPRYWLSLDHKLYRRSFAGPYLLCLHPKKVNKLLTKLMGECVVAMLRTIFSTKSDDPGVLMATDTEGCRQICSKVRIVSKARPFDPPVSRSFETRQQPVAVRTMGA